MAINNNSFSTSTNIQFGSRDLDDFWMQAQSCLIPSISMSPPEVGGRAGARISLPADSVTYSDLVIDVPIDREWKTYDLIYQYFLDGLNVEKGTFASKKFDMWLDIRTGKGAEIKKFWFYNCRLIDISELSVSTTDAEDSINEVTLVFKFDYMDYDGRFLAARG